MPPATRELAPVERPADDDVPNDVADRNHTAPKAPVFPTEADVDAITAHVLDKNPDLVGASHHKVTRAVQAEIAAEAERLSRARHRRHQAVEILTAPVFPTEAHVADLHRALPNITPEESAAVLHAGHAAFVATLAAGEPITEPPAEES